MRLNGFFRAFNRFYKVRCGFSTVKSAKRELIFFLLMYLFVQQADSGKAPIESILPRARGMPFYQLVNDPLKIIVGLADVKQKQILRRLSASQTSHSHNGYATATDFPRHKSWILP